MPLLPGQLSVLHRPVETAAGSGQKVAGAEA